MYGSASLHLTAPLPIKDLDVVRSHAFVQTGSLTSYNWGLFVWFVCFKLTNFRLSYF